MDKNNGTLNICLLPKDCFQYLCFPQKKVFLEYSSLIKYSLSVAFRSSSITFFTFILLLHHNFRKSSHDMRAFGNEKNFFYVTETVK